MWKLAGKARLENEMQVDFPHLCSASRQGDMLKTSSNRAWLADEGYGAGAVDAAETRLPWMSVMRRSGQDGYAAVQSQESENCDGVLHPRMSNISTMTLFF